MTLSDHLRQLADALPSDRSAVTFTKADLLTLVERAGPSAPSGPDRDLTVEEVAAATRRAPSTVRGWLISGHLKGYKLNGRDWRVTRVALREYLDRQRNRSDEDEGHRATGGKVDIGAWRRESGP
jgi:excisionase family DNA binding protein